MFNGEGRKVNSLALPPVAPQCRISNKLDPSSTRVDLHKQVEECIIEKQDTDVRYTQRDNRGDFHYLQQFHTLPQSLNVSNTHKISPKVSS